MCQWTRNIFSFVITRLFMACFITMQSHFAFRVSLGFTDFFFKERISTESPHCGSLAKFGLLPVFVNKVLLEHCHAHLFTYFLWQLFHYNGRIEWLWQKPYGPVKPQIYIYIYYLVPWGKKIADPWPRMYVLFFLIAVVVIV